MAGKKDNIVVAIIGDLTSEQQAQMSKEILKAKKKYAPHGRGTVQCTDRETIGKILQKETRKLIERKK